MHTSCGFELDGGAEKVEVDGGVEAGHSNHFEIGGIVEFEKD